VILRAWRRTLLFEKRSAALALRAAASSRRRQLTTAVAAWWWRTHSKTRMRRLRSRALLQRQVRAFEGWRECHEGKVERRAARRRFGFRGWLEGMHAQQAARAEAALKRRVSRLEATMAERLTACFVRRFQQRMLRACLGRWHGWAGGKTAAKTRVRRAAWHMARLRVAQSLRLWRLALVEQGRLERATARRQRRVLRSCVASWVALREHALAVRGVVHRWMARAVQRGAHWRLAHWRAVATRTRRLRALSDFATVRFLRSAYEAWRVATKRLRHYKMVVAAVALRRRSNKLFDALVRTDSSLDFDRMCFASH